MKMGSRVVVVSNLQYLKDLFNRDSVSFRPIINKHFLKAIKEIKGGAGFHGIANSQGKEWQEQRRFALQNLRNLGFGKSSMEDGILDEIHELCSNIRSKIKENDEQNLTIYFAISVLNILWNIITGKRLDMNSKKDQELLKMTQTMFDFLGGAKIFVALAAPFWLRRFNPYFKELKQHFKTMFDMLLKEKEEHLDTYDPNDMRDYMDIYITEMMKVQNEDNTESSFFGESGHYNFLNSFFEIFLAGNDTTSQTLSYLMMYMINFPDVQENVQAEIDKVVTRSRMPLIEDQANLPYTTAVIAEAQRHSIMAYHSDLVRLILDLY